MLQFFFNLDTQFRHPTSNLKFKLKVRNWKPKCQFFTKLCNCQKLHSITWDNFEQCSDSMILFSILYFHVYFEGLDISFLNFYLFFPLSHYYVIYLFFLYHRGPFTVKIYLDLGLFFRSLLVVTCEYFVLPLLFNFYLKTFADTEINLWFHINHEIYTWDYIIFVVWRWQNYQEMATSHV